MIAQRLPVGVDLKGCLRIRSEWQVSVQSAVRPRMPAWNALASLSVNSAIRAPQRLSHLRRRRWQFQMHDAQGPPSSQRNPATAGSIDCQAVDSAVHQHAVAGGEPGQCEAPEKHRP